jgi:hypothetical protein
VTDLGPRGAGCTIVEKLDEQLEDDFPLILVQQAGSSAPRGGWTRFNERVMRLGRRIGDE